MKIKFSEDFYDLLNDIMSFIALDKPLAAKKFRKDIIAVIKKDLKYPYNYKKSAYFNDENYRDYVFKGYTISYQILNSDVFILGIIKNRFSY